MIEDKNIGFRRRYQGLSDSMKVDLALEHLASYAFVGFYENLPALCGKLVRRFGWARGAVPHLARSNRPGLETSIQRSLNLSGVSWNST